ncbi:MAG: ArsR/SmtB family transcription factor [Salinirussus sp.]
MSDRLERLIAERVGACHEGDVEERISWLKAHVTEADTNVDKDTAALGALGDETRYRLAKLLVTADDELCVCELAPVVDVSESAISHALADLREAGLVRRRKDGTWRYYESTPRSEAVFDALDATREATA